MFFIFTKIYDINAGPWRNRVIPKAIFFTLKLIFVYIPVSKCLLFALYVWQTTLMSEIAGPWLLACSITCLFILVVWYRTMIVPKVKACKDTLKN